MYQLIFGSLNGSAVTTSLSGSWYQFNFGGALNLPPSTVFAIVLRTSGDPIHWKAAKTYLNGNPGASGDQGGRRPLADPEYDFLFEVVGDPDLITGTVATATGIGAADIAVDGGTLDPTSIRTYSEADLTPAAQASLPPGFDFSHGFFGFNISGLAEGANVTVTLTLPENVPIGTRYWKFQDGVWVKLPLEDDD